MDTNAQAKAFLAQSQAALAENKAPLATKYLMFAASLPISDADVLHDLLERAKARKSHKVMQNALARSPLRANAPDLQLLYAEILSKRGQYELARAGYIALAEHETHGPTALHALGFMAMFKGEIDVAFAYARQLQQRQPDKPNGLTLQARIETELGALDLAEATIAKAEEIAPLDKPPHFLLQRKAIQAGDFAGMFFHMSQREKPATPMTGSDVPLLCNLNDAQGKNLVVYGEQGFGDMLQFCRFIPALVGIPKYLGYYVHPKLKRVMGAIGDTGVELFSSDISARCPDYVLPLMDVPHLIGASTISASPYLSAEPDAVARWRERIGAQGYKIGIVWQGNPEGAIDFGRSMPLGELARLAEISSVRLISLQKGTGIEQIAALPRFDVIEVFEDLDSGPDAFVDTVAAACCLDLVVTIDTSVAHAVGALGLPAVLLAKCNPEWRWTFPPTDRSVWYENTRIIRQPTPNDWAGAVDALLDYVHERMQNA
ncbi:MAG: hypothetical protein WD046_03970 [Paracoccaceae bacterium]